MSLDPSTLISSFLALPRNCLSPSGSVSNTWNFSIRHVPIDPPGSVLFLLNPGSGYVHVEGPLPPASDTESLAVRANIIALLLMKSFVGSLGGAASVGRPWEWKTDDAEMAGALGECLKGMGIGEGLEAVGVVGNEERRRGEEEWGKFLRGLVHVVDNPGSST
ncbi:MAG: hypothetical protein LQ349_001581 [Xanthoria aureola]|nr:MAG: hypothetical protein LQ349_001581 [Xanthoria aureola]